MIAIGGNITDLVAYMKYNGDKYSALCELMSEYQNNRDFRREISKRDEFANNTKNSAMNYWQAIKKSPFKQEIICTQEALPMR